MRSPTIETNAAGGVLSGDIPRFRASAPVLLLPPICEMEGK